MWRICHHHKNISSETSTLYWVEVMVKFVTNVCWWLKFDLAFIKKYKFLLQLNFLFYFPKARELRKNFSFESVTIALGDIIKQRRYIVLQMWEKRRTKKCEKNQAHKWVHRTCGLRLPAKLCSCNIFYRRNLINPKLSV